MDEADLRVRLAAFAFLDEQRKLSAELLDRSVLQRGFVFDGERVPLVGASGNLQAARLPMAVEHHNGTRQRGSPSSVR